MLTSQSKFKAFRNSRRAKKRKRRQKGKQDEGVQPHNNTGITKKKKKTLHLKQKQSGWEGKLIGTVLIEDIGSLNCLLRLYLGVVILPDPASDLMATQIKGLELDFTNTQLLRGRILCWLMLY